MNAKPSIVSKKNLFKLGRATLFVFTLFALFLHGQYAKTADSLPKKLFGTVEFPVPSEHSLEKWEATLNKIENEKSIYIACDETPEECQNDGLKEWRAFIASHQGEPLEKLIPAVNTYANRWPYRTDSQTWGQKDYWETPMEFMANSGDCEDYSIFKYVTFRALGVPAEHMRLVIVQDTVRKVTHAVLAVYTSDDIMILDSLFKIPLPHKKVLQYTPYYSVNEKQRWMHLKPMSSFAPLDTAAK